MLFGGETAQSYYEEGITAAMKGDLPLAVSRFKRALELDTQLHHAQHQIGKCFLRMGQPKEALEHLQIAAKRLPELALPKIEVGYAFLLLHKVEEARTNFSDALMGKSDDPRAVMGLARCAAEEEQWGTVAGLTQHALDLGYSHFDTHLLKARAEDKCGTPEAAQRHYNQAVKLIDQSIDANPDQPTGYYLRGMAYFYQDNYSAAITDFDEALAKADQNSHYSAYNEHFTVLDILCMKGRCQEHFGHGGKARETGKRILELAPDNELGKRLFAADISGETGKDSA